MRYIVTAERPTYCEGVDRSIFDRSDVIEVSEGDRPDSDGDLYASRVSDGRRGHINAGQIRPATESSTMLDSRSVRAALAVCGLNDEAARKVLETAEKIAGVL